MNASTAYRPTPAWALPLPVCVQCGQTIAAVIVGCLLPTATIRRNGRTYCPACDAEWGRIEAQMGAFVLTAAGRQVTSELGGAA